jgi:hypothetical protein
MQAVTRRNRQTNLPKIPTMQDLGFKDFEATTFSGMTALEEPLKTSLSEAHPKSSGEPSIRTMRF